MSFAQRADHGLVDKHGDAGVYRALEQIEGQENGGQHFGNGIAGHAHIDGGDDVIPEQHHRRHENGCGNKADDRALESVVLFVDAGGGAGKGAGGDKVHYCSVDAGIGNGHHFNEGHHEGDEEGRDGTHHETADGDDDVLGLIFEEHDHGYAHECHDDEGNGTEHRDGGEFLGAGLHW